MKLFSSLKKRFLTFFCFLTLAFGTIGTIGIASNSVSHFGNAAIAKETTSSWTAGTDASSNHILSGTNVTITVGGSGTLNSYSQVASASITASSTTNEVSISGTLTLTFSSTIKMTSISFGYGQSGLAYNTNYCSVNGGSSSLDNSVLHYPAVSTSVTNTTGSNGSNPNTGSSNDKTYLNTYTATPNSKTATFTCTYSGKTSKLDSSYNLAGLIISASNFSVTMARDTLAISAASNTTFSIDPNESKNITINSLGGRTLSVVSNTPSGIASTSISSNVLTVKGSSAGTATINLLASQTNDYESAVLTLKVTVRASQNMPTPSTTYDQATNTIKNLASSASYTLTYSGGTISVTTNSSTTTYCLQSYEKKTITKITRNASAQTSTTNYVATSQTVSYYVIPRATAPSLSYNSVTGELSELTTGETYGILNTAGTTTEITATGETMDIATSFAGQTLKTAYLKGTYVSGNTATTSDTINSLPSTITTTGTGTTTKVLAHADLLGVSYSQQTGLITGLTSGKSYTLTYNTNTTKTFTATGTSYDVATNLAAGSLLSKIKFNGDNSTYTDAEKEISGTVLTHRTTPTASYDVSNGYLSGLSDNETYELAYTSTTGASLTYTIKTDGTDTLYSSGKYDLSGAIKNEDTLSKATIVSLTLKGDGTTTSDSLPETSAEVASKVIYPRQEVESSSDYDKKTGFYMALEAGASYTVGYTTSSNEDKTIDLTADTSASIDIATLISDSAPFKLTSIIKNGVSGASINSFLASLDKNVYQHIATPTLSFDSTTGYLTNLVDGASYTLTYLPAGETQNKTISLKADEADSLYSKTDGSYDLSAITDLLNASTIEVKRMGDYATTCDSLYEDLGAKKVLPREETTAENFSLKKGKILGLVEGNTYTVGYLDASSDPQTYTFLASSATANYSSSEKSLDLSLMSTPSFTGAKINSICIDGDGTSSANSYLTDEKSSPVLPHEVTPTADYSSSTGYMSGLVKDASYELSYTDSNGDSKTYSFSPSGTNFDLAEVSALKTGNIVSLAKVGNYTSTSDSLDETTFTNTLIIPRETDPSTSEVTFTLTKGLLSGLKDGGSYRIKLTDGTSKAFTLASGETSIDLSLDTTLSNKVISSITKTGDGTSTIDSHIISMEETSEKDRTIYPHFETPTTTFLPSDGYLRNLVSGASYSLNYTSKTGNASTYVFVATETTSLDISSIDELKGATILSVMRNNDLATTSPTHTDSLLETSLTGLVVIPRLATPTSSFEEKYGVISGLVPTKDYSLVFSDGTSATLTSDETGAISLSSHETLSEKKVISITIVGDPSASVPSLTSYAQVVADSFPSLDDVKALIKKEALASLDKAVKDEDDKDPDNDLSDKAEEVAKATKETIETSDPSTMTIDEYKGYLTEVVTEATAEIDFEVLRTSIIEQITAKKRNCTDETLDHYIEGAVTKVKNQGYTYATREADTASLYAIRDESMAGISLIMTKIEGVQTITKALETDLSSSRSPIGYEKAANELTEHYTDLINEATSEEEVATLTKQYSTELTTLRNEYSSGVHCFIHWIDLAVLISYLAFAIIYGAIFHHKKMDGIYAGVGIATLALTIALSFFIYDKIDLWLTIALYVVLFILNLLLIFQKDDKKKKKEKLVLATSNGAPVESSVTNVVPTPIEETSKENKVVPVKKPRKKRVIKKKKKMVTKKVVKPVVAPVAPIKKVKAKKVATTPVKTKKKKAPVKKAVAPVISKPIKLTTLSHIYGKKSRKGKLR